LTKKSGKHINVILRHKVEVELVLVDLSVVELSVVELTANQVKYVQKNTYVSILRCYVAAWVA
jgi:hypothetical protein